MCARSIRYWPLDAALLVFQLLLLFLPQQDPRFDAVRESLRECLRWYETTIQADTNRRHKAEGQRAAETASSALRLQVEGQSDASILLEELSTADSSASDLPLRDLTASEPFSLRQRGVAASPSGFSYADFNSNASSISASPLRPSTSPHSTGLAASTVYLPPLSPSIRPVAHISMPAPRWPLSTSSAAQRPMHARDLSSASRVSMDSTDSSASIGNSAAFAAYHRALELLAREGFDEDNECLEADDSSDWDRYSQGALELKLNEMLTDNEMDEAAHTGANAATPREREASARAGPTPFSPARAAHAQMGWPPALPTATLSATPCIPEQPEPEQEQLDVEADADADADGDGDEVPEEEDAEGEEEHSTEQPGQARSQRSRVVHIRGADVAAAAASSSSAAAASAPAIAVPAPASARFVLQPLYQPRGVVAPVHIHAAAAQLPAARQIVASLQALVSPAHAANPGVRFEVQNAGWAGWFPRAPVSAGTRVHRTAAVHLLVHEVASRSHMLHLISLLHSIQIDEPEVSASSFFLLLLHPHGSLSNASAVLDALRSQAACHPLLSAMLQPDAASAASCPPHAAPPATLQVFSLALRDKLLVEPAQDDAQATALQALAESMVRTTTHGTQELGAR